MIAAVSVAADAMTARADEHASVWAEPDPAAVIGHWRGTARWRGCPPGPARVAIEVTRDGSGYRTDLAPVLDGLGAIDLVPASRRGLDMQRDDLRVTWTTGKHNRATLSVGFASGCTGTLALTRDGSGAPACDELRALRVLGAMCPAAVLPTIPPEDATAIDGVDGLRGAARSRTARVCTRHVAPWRAALVDVGCVPPPFDPSRPTVRVPACEALLVTTSQLMRCDKVPADVKTRLHLSMQKVARWSTVSPGDDEAELRARAAETCREARDELRSTMQLVGCL